MPVWILEGILLRQDAIEGNFEEGRVSCLCLHTSLFGHLHQQKNLSMYLSTMTDTHNQLIMQRPGLSREKKLLRWSKVFVCCSLCRKMSESLATFPAVSFLSGHMTICSQHSFIRTFVYYNVLILKHFSICFFLLYSNIQQQYRSGCHSETETYLPLVQVSLEFVTTTSLSRQCHQQQSVDKPMHKPESLFKQDKRMKHNFLITVEHSQH